MASGQPLPEGNGPAFTALIRGNIHLVRSLVMKIVHRCSAFAVVLTFLAAGCSHSHSAADSTSSSPPSTSLTGTSVYAALGNFTVGVTTLHLPTGNDVEVWYPANGGVGVGDDTYDVRSFLPTSVTDRLDPSVHDYVSTIANRNVEAGAPGEEFPLVVFSHGYAGFRDESTFLMTRLASWGMFVAAPEHPSRDLAHVLAPTAGHVPSDVDDLRATIDLLQRANATNSPFNDRIDLSKIAVVGYDAGASAAMTVAADPRVDGYVVLAADTSPSAGNSGPALPEKPSLFVGAANDRVAPVAETTALYRAASAPSYEWVLSGAGHNAFDDLCVVAKNQGGLITLFEHAGIGSSFPASLRTRVTDGCAPPNLDITKTWTAIDQVVTGFLRTVVGPDRTAVGVGPAGNRTIDGVPVTVSVRAR
jgi:dienelactone hydrolase